MKLVPILLIFGFLQLSAASVAQQVSLSVKHASLQEIFAEITRQTGYQVVYQSEQLEKALPVSIHLQQASLADAMKQILAGQGLEFVLDEKEIVIKEKEKSILDVILPSRHPERSETESNGSSQQETIRGRVTDSLGTPLENATIRIKGTNRATFTGKNGEFTLRGVEDNATLQISYLGFITRELPIPGPLAKIILYRTSAALEEAQVVYNNGYQQISKERVTGAYEKINSANINRAVSPDILSRLDGNFSALSNNGNVTSRTIRGINSINSSSFPLIVVDNFPYDGDINNINPNDVSSVTLLKDAAASSIWGSIAGNGVLVITTKKGDYNQKTSINFSSNVSVTAKPDLLKNQQISTSDYIDLEEYLFGQGAYDGDFTNTYSYPIISPVVQLLQDQKNNLISQTVATSKIDQLRNIDVRNDYSKYLYRNSVNQQYALDISGGSNTFNYRTSVGFDKDLSSFVGNGSNRTTFNTALNYSPIKNLDISSTTTFTQSSNTNNSIGGGGLSIGTYSSTRPLYPYARLMNNDGNSVSFPSFNPTFSDVPGSDQLLDWSYNPLNELKYADNTSKLKDLLMSFSFKYRILPGLSASAFLQHEDQILKSSNYHSLESFYTRDLINKLTTITDGVVSHGIPLGGILEGSDGELISNSARGQLDFARTFAAKHEINISAMSEIKQQTRQTHNWGSYGYNADVLTTQSVDYATTQQTFNNGMFGILPISDPTSYLESLNRAVSFLGSASYTYANRYVISGSIRKEESNLFGVKTNQKGLPLYSAGLAWNISQEKFFHVQLINELKLRASVGSGGIINNQVAALTTLLYIPFPTFYYGLPYAHVENYPNPDLKYEQVNQKNVGIDFILKNNILSGSIDIYAKKSTDLLSPVPFDITSGTASLTKNSADMTNNGFDLTLNILNINKVLKWHTTFYFEKNTSTVTNYKYLPSGNAQTATVYIGTGTSLTPKEGLPPYNLITYRFAGLDPETGDPLGYLNGEVSKDYQSILGQATWDDVKIHGSLIPTVFGTLRNSFDYKNISASFSIGYKFNYFFNRTNTIRYSYMLGGRLLTKEFENRWQKPGDELKTNVPSMVYPFDGNRDQYYGYSDAAVEKADNIRLNDVQVSYVFYPFKSDKYARKSIAVYGYASNLAIIWKATKTALDPDTGSGVPISKSISIGCKFNF